LIKIQFFCGYLRKFIYISRIKIIIIIIINNWWNSEATKLGKMMTIKRPTKFRSYPFGPLKLQQNGKFLVLYIFISAIGWFMMFNATFNNISTISWQSVLLVEETGVPRENHWPLVSHWKLYHIMLHRVIVEILLNVALNIINQPIAEILVNVCYLIPIIWGYPMLYINRNYFLLSNILPLWSDFCFY
jgi:hypothetical protein